MALRRGYRLYSLRAKFVIVSLVKIYYKHVMITLFYLTPVK